MKPKNTLYVFLLILSVAAVYANTINNPFVLDDISSIVENKLIRSLWPIGPYFERSRPFAMLSLGVNYAFGGLDARGYHAVNMVIHALAGVTLFFWLRLAFRSPRLKFYYPAADELAFAIAILWLVHPLQTQSVTYVIQRTESLMGLCYLFMMYCGARTCMGGSNKKYWAAAATIVCALGMLTKEVMFTAPLMLLLYDRVFISTSFAETYRLRRGWYATLFSCWLIIPLTYASGMSASAGISEAIASPIEYARSQPGVIVHYLKLAVWPRILCLDYLWPVASRAGQIMPAGLFVGIVVIITVRLLFTGNAAGFLGAWFFIVLAPTSTIMPIADLAVEHRMYLSLAAVIVLVVTGWYTWVERWNIRRNLSPLVKRFLTRGILLICVVALSRTTLTRNEVYASEISLWMDVVAKRPQNYRAYNAVGEALAKEGRLSEAMHYYKRATDINPLYAEAHSNLGAALLRDDKIPEATKQLNQALDISPNLAKTHFTLGNLKMRTGDTVAAESHYRTALRADPNYAKAHNSLGVLLAGMGQYKEAAARYFEAIRLDDRYAMPHLNLGNLYLYGGDVKEAVSEYREALRIRPDYAKAEDRLRQAERMLGVSSPS